jgi:molybdopterin-biosynthesis enzyme MoeA-like protein
MAISYKILQNELAAALASWNFLEKYFIPPTPLRSLRLSGRTKDQNVGYIAEYLTAVGINLKEVRVVGDEETAIVDALNALRHRCTYVFTTGGIGPTHGDISADCVAKAFGVPIDTDPRALAILHEW